MDSTLQIFIFVDILQILTNLESRKYLAGYQGSMLYIAAANVTNCGFVPLNESLKDVKNLGLANGSFNFANVCFFESSHLFHIEENK